MAVFVGGSGRLLPGRSLSRARDSASCEAMGMHKMHLSMWPLLDALDGVCSL